MNFGTRNEKEEYKKALWKSILYELSKKSFEVRTKVTIRCHELMFELLSKYNVNMSENLWKMLFSDLLKAMFDDLHIKMENKSTDIEMHNIYLDNANTIITNIINMIKNMEQEKFSISVKILLDTIQNFAMTNQNSPISIVMIEGMKTLTRECSEMFNEELWKCFINVVCTLFENKEDKSLLVEQKGSNDEEFKVPSQYDKSGNRNPKLSTLYQTQASRLLKLIENTDDIAKRYNEIEGEDLMKLLKNLEMSYDIIHKFNLNIERRFELYAKIDLRSIHDKVPILLRHEINILEVYFIFLNELYNNEKTGISKDKIVDRIVAF